MTPFGRKVQRALAGADSWCADELRVRRALLRWIVAADLPTAPGGAP
jgi:hypothetical protein